MLTGLGVERPAVDTEIASMSEWRVAKTNSRQVLGSMLDFANMLEWYLDRRSFQEVALHLAESPCSPLNMDCPTERTRKLFRTPALRLVKEE